MPVERLEADVSARRFRGAVRAGSGTVPTPRPPCPPPTARWCSSGRKRSADIVLVVVSLPLTILLCAVLAAVSAAMFRCRPIFLQVRRGIDEQPISVLKIRSLPRDFPDNLGKHELDEQQFTRWGRFLRNSHLDELPQVFNVLVGSMSLVGPRPMIDSVVSKLEPDDRRKRAVIRPGLTGPWQVSTAGSLSLHACPDLDNEYVAKATATGDLKILLCTIQTVLGWPTLTPESLRRRLDW
jgi:lipopolysaccharide/colanic/teichoic acid biosynthesis glycosyltransferase